MNGLLLPHLLKDVSDLLLDSKILLDTTQLKFSIAHVQLLKPNWALSSGNFIYFKDFKIIKYFGKGMESLRKSSET